MEGDKTVCHKYDFIKTSARVGYAPHVWKRAQAQGLNDYRLIIREDEGQGLVSSDEVCSSPVI